MNMFLDMTFTKIGTNELYFPQISIIISCKSTEPLDFEI